MLNLVSIAREGNETQKNNDIPVYQDTSIVKLPKFKRLHKVMLETHLVIDEPHRLIVEKIREPRRHKSLFSFWEKIKVML